jgi:hypothetical protein
MARRTYTSICFQTNHGDYADDDALQAALRKGTGVSDLTVERVNYDDGSWSTWFAIPVNGADPYALGNKIEDNVKGVHSIMLRTDTNDIDPLHPVRNKYGLGALKPPGM